ncbi:MAG: PepSY-associated TM helix domain-containing protein [Betaproteobacteria bacterium]
MTRKLLLQIHKTIALSVGVFIAIVCLSGASLVFRDVLAPWFTPAMKIEPQASSPGEYERVLAAATARVPEAASVEIRPPARRDLAVDVALDTPDARRLYVNPQTGAVVADSATQWLPFHSLFRLHRYLLTGAWGEYLVAGIGTLLVVMAISGFVLWWPRAWSQALRVRWSGNRMAVSFDLHKATGACFALFLLANALTGLVLIFSGVSTTLVNRIFSVADAVPPTIVRPAAAGNVKPLDELVAAANRSFPAGTVTQVVVRGGDFPVVVRKRTVAENNPLGTNRIYVDPWSGEVIGMIALETAPPGNKMYEWLYPFHIGALFGTLYKLVLALAGLAPSVLLVTGLIVWWTRSRMRKKTLARKVQSANE